MSPVSNDGASLFGHSANAPKRRLLLHLRRAFGTTRLWRGSSPQSLMHAFYTFIPERTSNNSYFLK